MLPLHAVAVLMYGSDSANQFRSSMSMSSSQTNLRQHSSPGNCRHCMSGSRRMLRMLPLHVAAAPMCGSDSVSLFRNSVSTPSRQTNLLQHSSQGSCRRCITEIGRMLHMMSLHAAAAPVGGSDFSSHCRRLMSMCPRQTNLLQHSPLGQFGKSSQSQPSAQLFLTGTSLGEAWPKSTFQATPEKSS
jgi:hypothetical protein